MKCKWGASLNEKGTNPTFGPRHWRALLSTGMLTPRVLCNLPERAVVQTVTFGVGGFDRADANRLVSLDGLRFVFFRARSEASRLPCSDEPAGQCRW